MHPTIVLVIVLAISHLGESHRVVRKAADDSFLSPAKYHNTAAIRTLFKKLQRDYPKLAKFYSVGKSVEKRDLWVIEINGKVANRTKLTPMFKWVGNMHGDETVGRQMLVYLAQYLLYNYGKDKRVTQLVDSTDIHIMPSMNPDGFENSEVRQLVATN